MIKTYKSRKQMQRDNFIGFDATNMTRDNIVSHIKSIGYQDFHFDTVAISHGVYGVNGDIIDVETNNDIPETITTFSILSRSTTLLEFM